MRWPLLLLAACSNGSNGNVDAPVQPVDAPIAARILVVNEVAPGEAPDWIEVVNATTSPVQLADFAYVDVAGDFTKMKPFPAVTLPAGAYYTQDVDDATSGFKLGSDEELWVYRIADHVLSDGVDWDQGAAPTGTSYRRIPDTTGDFATGAQSKGLPN